MYDGFSDDAGRDTNNVVFLMNNVTKVKKIKQWDIKEKLAYVVVGWGYVLFVYPFSQEFGETAAAALYCYGLEV